MSSVQLIYTYEDTEKEDVEHFVIPHPSVLSSSVISLSLRRMKAKITSRFINQTALGMEVNLRLGEIANALESLAAIESKMSAISMSPLSKGYAPDIFEHILDRLLYLCYSDTEEFVNPLEQFLCHWISLFASFSANSFVNIIRKLVQKESKIEEYAPLLYFASNVLLNMNSKQRAETVHLCEKLIQHCPLKYIPKSNDLFWETLRDIHTADELEKLFPTLEQIQFATKSAIICQKDSKKLTPKLLSRVSLEYVSSFLKAFPIDCEFDCINLNARVAEGMNMDDEDEFVCVLGILPMLMKRLSHWNNAEELTTLKPLWKGIIKRIPNSDESEKHILIHSLLVAEQENLINFGEIKHLLEISTDQSPIIQKELLSLFFNRLSNSSEIFQFMKEIAEKRNTDMFGSLIDEFTVHYDELKRINEEETEELLHRILVPPSNIASIREKVFRMRVECNLIERSEMEKECVKIMNENPSEEIVEFIEKLDIKIPFEKLDWFTQEMVRLNFRVVSKDIDPFFVLELLTCGFIEPGNVAEPLEHLLKCIDTMGPIISTTIFATLTNAMKCMGFPMETLENHIVNIVESASHVWFDDEQLKTLLGDVAGVFERTEFGGLMNSLMKYCVEFRKGATFQPSIVSAIISYCVYLGPLLPETTCMVISCFWGDMQSSKMPFPQSMKKTVMTNMKAFFANEFPEHSKKTVVVTAATVLGDKAAFSMLENDIMKLIECDYEVTSLFADVLPRRLPPLRTWLALAKRDDRREWASMCQAEIDESEWIRSFDILPLEKQVLSEPVMDDACSYQHSEVVISEGVQIHETESATEMNMISFLWHSNDKIPDALFSQIHEYVLANPAKTRLVVGLFSYAKCQNRVIDVDSFATVLDFDPRDILSTYAVILFIGFITGPVSSLAAPVRQFIDKILYRIGCYSFTRAALMRLLSNSTGLIRVLIEAILLIDIEHFDYYNRKTVFDWCLGRIDGQTTDSDYCDIISALSKVACSDETYSCSCLPTNTPSPLDSFLFLADPTKRFPVPESFGLKLVEMLGNEVFITREMATCLFSLDLPLRLISDLVTSKLERRASVVCDVASFDSAAEYIRQCFTPSSLRSMIRQSIRFGVKVSQDVIGDTLVHEALCYAYSGLWRYSCRHVDVCNKLQMGIVTLETVMTAHTEMMISESQRQHRILKSLLYVSDKALEALHAWKSANEARLEFVALLLDCIAVANPTACFAVEAMQVITECVPVEELRRNLVERMKHREGHKLGMEIVQNRVCREDRKVVNISVLLHE